MSTIKGEMIFKTKKHFKLFQSIPDKEREEIFKRITEGLKRFIDEIGDTKGVVIEEYFYNEKAGWEIKHDTTMEGGKLVTVVEMVRKMTRKEIKEQMNLDKAKGVYYNQKPMKNTVKISIQEYDDLRKHKESVGKIILEREFIGTYDSRDEVHTTIYTHDELIKKLIEEHRREVDQYKKQSHDLWQKLYMLKYASWRTFRRWKKNDRDI